MKPGIPSEPPASSAPLPLPKAPEPSPIAPSIPPSSTEKPPVPPPPTTAPAELPPRSPTAEERISELLSRYRAALESRNLDELKRIWPTLAGSPQEAIRKEFQHSSRIAVEIVDPRVQVSGTNATVSFLRRYDLLTTEGQRLHSETRTVMEVRRTSSGAWVIDTIRFTPVR
jgi:hypothetical protein